MGVFEGMGSDLLVANFQMGTEVHTVSSLDIATLQSGRLREGMRDVLAVAPLMPSSVEARVGGRSLSTVLIGTNSELIDVLDLAMTKGRFLSPLDVQSTHVVMGANAAAQWEKAGISLDLGDQVALGGYLFQVIGILRRNGENPLLPLQVDDAILTSMEGMRRVIAAPQISSVLVRSAGGDTSSRIAVQLQQWLEREMPHQTIGVQVPQQLIDGIARQSRLFSWMLAGVGGIALLVGGIGVMNVMVMSVTERRCEIGVRMALGARPWDIAGLFLMESLFLAVTGAVTGAALGVSVAWVFVHFSGWSSFSSSWSAVILGMGSVTLTGLFFGLSPAMAAARLTPTQALRDE